MFKFCYIEEHEKLKTKFIKEAAPQLLYFISIDPNYISEFVIELANNK